MKKLILLFFVMALVFPARAQETAPEATCTAGETNYTRQTGGPEANGVLTFLQCNGTKWLGTMRIDNANGNFLVDNDGGGSFNKYAVSGSNNILFGYNAGAQVGSQSNNIMMGGGAGYRTTGQDNTFVGVNAGGRAETSYNVAIGRSALGTNGSGPVAMSNTTAIGWHAGFLSQGSSSLYLGKYAGRYAQGNNNIFIGTDTGDNGGATTTGANNILIGNDIELPTTSTSSFLSIADLIYGEISAGEVGIGTNAPQAELDVNGDIYFSGIIRDMSDRRLKADIHPVSNALEGITSLDGVSFVMKDDTEKRREFGLIAQDVQSVFPDLVDADSNGILGLNYIGLIAPLIEALKELDKKISDQDDAIVRLEAENAKLRRMLHQVTARMDVIEGKRRPPLKPYNP